MGVESNGSRINRGDHSRESLFGKAVLFQKEVQNKAINFEGEFMFNQRNESLTLLCRKKDYYFEL